MATNFATNLLAFIIVLGVLIFAHEAGHFLFAKLFRVRVLVFSFGFGQRLFGFKRGDTDYRVSLIPLGGYVRMAGDTPGESQEGLPDEYLSRPKWQRFLILLAGPGANIVIAILFFAILFMVGIQVANIKPVIGTVLPDKPAARAGLQPGDRVIAANGDSVRSFEELRLAIAVNPETPVTLTVVRDGRTVDIVVIPERTQTEYGTSGVAGFQPFIEPIVGGVTAGSAAAVAGLQPGDRILRANEHSISQIADLEKIHDEAKKKPVQLLVQRGGQTTALSLPAMRPAEKDYPGILLPTVVRKYGFTAAFRESLRQNWRLVKYTFQVIGRLFRAKGSVKDFTGPISIARISGRVLRTGWIELVSLMAAISLQLGIMNLLPIPVLDGGHIFILGVESAARRDLSIRAKERIQQLGFAVLALLMIVVLYNDVIQNVMLMRRG